MSAYSDLIRFPEQLTFEPNAIAAFYEGVKDGVRLFAVWNNGEQYVGVQRRPLKEVLAALQAEKESLILNYELKEKLA